LSSSARKSARGHSQSSRVTTDGQTSRDTTSPVDDAGGSGIALDRNATRDCEDVHDAQRTTVCVGRLRANVVQHEEHMTFI
jgi:hypothetical protein